MRRVIICAMTLVMLAQQSYAQSSYYTVLQATGTLGVKNPGYKGAFSGYALHFIFGKNFNERFFVKDNALTVYLQGKKQNAAACFFINSLP